ncbi:MAG: TetR/AcrR family transcriptional regulator [Paucimonas sp.]|nr:TetR/AcrR family transcriptional regulator [Paucimonas sp.]
MRDPDRTRRSILKFASQEFAAKGFAGARVDEIARKAGINKQALYYHFGSKEDVYRAAMENGFQRFREHDAELASEAYSPVEALVKLTTNTFNDLQDTKELTGMLADVNRHKGKHLDVKRVREINAPVIGLITSILERGERDGVFRPGVCPVQFYLSMMSLLIFSFSNVYTLSAIVGEDLKTKAAVQKRREHVIELLLASLRPGPLHQMEK